MRYEILVTDEARGDLRRFSARVRREVEDAIELHLGHEPAKVSKSRIKRLRDLVSPQYRLRIGEVRVFYDLDGRQVIVLAVVTKRDTTAWLEQFGERS